MIQRHNTYIKKCYYCKQPNNKYKPWEDYPYWHAARMCKLTKPELVKWTIKELGWSSSDSVSIHKGELRQMWCYKNNIIL